MDEVIIFRIIGAVACLLGAFMVFVFGAILLRRWRERQPGAD
ncbi:hypothetical protein [Beijerinckia sp. L45]|nr:hypothetical protein [Beijerinckia sp. L45]